MARLRNLRVLDLRDNPLDPALNEAYIRQPSIQRFLADLDNGTATGTGSAEIESSYSCDLNAYDTFLCTGTRTRPPC